VGECRQNGVPLADQVAGQRGGERDQDRDPQPTPDLARGVDEARGEALLPLLGSLGRGDRGRNDRHSDPGCGEDAADDHVHDRALAAILVNGSIPAVIIKRPEPRTARTPNRLTSLPALRATNMIVSAIGRKVRPAWSGERPSTCCRYSELMYHMGNSAALNSS